MKRPIQILATAALAWSVAFPCLAEPATTGPATRPAWGGATLSQDGKILLEFRDAPLKRILDETSSAAGIQVVQIVKLSGSATLVTRKPVTPEQAVALLDTAFRAHGYQVLSQGKYVKVMAKDQ